jgi:hypothetical protein
MISDENREWISEFKDFMNEDQAVVPKELQTKVMSKMHGLLNPHPFRVFNKVLAIHLGVGLISLAFCHQFGLNPFQTEFSLDNWFMKVGGHHFCMVACGFLYVALGLLAANYWLTIEELKALKRTGFLQISTLGLVSLALFYFFGGELVLGMAGLWLLGGLIAGFLTNQVVWKLRTI